MGEEVNNNTESESVQSTLKEKKICEEAIKKGDLNKVKKLISSGFYINQILSELPPLSLALSHGHLDIAMFLVSNGADVTLPDASGKHCPLFYAIKNKFAVPMIKKLISSGAHKDGIVEYNFNSTALHLAVYANVKPIIKFLISLSVDINCKDLNGLTPLHIAVQENHPKIIKLLVQNGASVDIESNDKFTPLMYAIHDSKPSLVRLMLNLGSDINYEPTEPIYSYQTPLNYAVGLGLITIVQELLTSGAKVKSSSAGDSPLHSLAFSCDFNNKILAQDIIKLLLEHGADLECVNSLGHSPLHISVFMKSWALTKALVVMGSSLKTTTSSMDTPLHVACKVGFAESVKCFLVNGADVTASNSEGLTPYDEALMQSDINIIRYFWYYGYPYDQSKLLAQEGSETNISKPVKRLIEHQQKLFLGIKTGNVSLVNEALNDGAEPRGCSLCVRFPLHFAVAQNSVEIVRLLLCKGACAGQLNENGQTPLHLAAQSGDSEICGLLLAHGACYDYFSSICPISPYQVAKDQKNLPVKKLLFKVNSVFKDLNNGRDEKVKKVLDQVFEESKSNKKQTLIHMFLNSINRKGQTLTAIAMEKGNFEMIEFILNKRLKLED